MSKTVWVEFTKPTLNYAKGDVVELDEERKEMVDGVIKKHFGNVEEDGGRTRYKVVDAPKAKKVSTVVDGVNSTAAKSGQSKPAAPKTAPATGDTPPAAGAGASN